MSQFHIELSGDTYIRSPEWSLGRFSHSIGIIVVVFVIIAMIINFIIIPAVFVVMIIYLLVEREHGDFLNVSDPIVKVMIIITIIIL